MYIHGLNLPTFLTITGMRGAAGGRQRAAAKPPFIAHNISGCSSCMHPCAESPGKYTDCCIHTRNLHILRHQPAYPSDKMDSGSLILSALTLFSPKMLSSFGSTF